MTKPEAGETGVERLAGHVETVEHALRKELYERNLAGISPGVEYQLSSGGKRLRPALALWFGEVIGVPELRILPFALAVELLHNVLLIHDDIEDGDTFRRGNPTLWSHLGVDIALNVSDHLLAEAYRLVGETARSAGHREAVELYRVFTEVFGVTVEGQALDLSARADPEFSLARYEEVIQKKTGRYLALGWVGTAIAGGLHLEDRECLWRVGAHLGPAFQIRDDVLDLSPGKGRGGVIGCDIREGKPSILFAHALERGGLDRDDRERLVRILAKPRAATTSEDVERVLALFERCGSVRFAQEQSRLRIEAGVREFESLSSLGERAAAEFRDIAEYVIERKV